MTLQVTMTENVFAAGGVLLPDASYQDLPEGLARQLVTDGKAVPNGSGWDLPRPDLTLKEVLGVRFAVPDAGSAIARVDAEATVFPDEAVRLTSSGCACAAPCYVTRIVCVTGSAIALTVYDNPAASSGFQLYSGTLSAGQEAVLSAEKVIAINGVRLAWTGSASFDVFLNTEPA